MADMFGVTPAFQGEEEALPRSRSTSRSISPRSAGHTPREFSSIGKFLQDDGKPEGASHGTASSSNHAVLNAFSRCI